MKNFIKVPAMCFLIFVFFPTLGHPLEIQKIGDENLLSGEIVSGDFERVVEFVSTNRTFPIVFALASPGGNVSEAMRIGRFFRDAKIIVNVISCDSACFLIWAGSPVRQGAIQYTQFKLHRPYFEQSTYQGIPLDEAIAIHETAEREFSNYLIEMGVPSFFVDRILTYRSSDSYDISGNGLVEIVGGKVRAVEEAMIAKCGELTDSEMVDLRRIRLFESAREALRNGEYDDDETMKSIFEQRIQSNEAFVSSLSTGYVEYLAKKSAEVTSCEGQILISEQLEFLRNAAIISF